MKKSYINLTIIMLSIIFILLLNSFLFHITSRLFLIVLVLITILITKYTVGLERKKKRYVKQILYELTIYLLIFFLLYYLSGLLIGFYRNSRDITNPTIIKSLILLITYIITKELLRYYLIQKSNTSIILQIICCIMMIILDITISLSSVGEYNAYNIFEFLSLTLLPSITENILLTYISKYYSYIPNIYYLIIMNLSFYILPIIPNPSEFLYSIIFFLLPVIILIRIIIFTKKTKTQKLELRVKNSRLITIIPACIIIFLEVYLTSGYFKYYSIAIASGSMMPTIRKGDIVIVDQKFKSNSLEEGQVIAVKYRGRIIVHRIEKLTREKDDIFIYTKGDNNNTSDNYVVTKDMIIGIANYKIPFIGYPTVWLSEVNNNEK